MDRIVVRSRIQAPILVVLLAVFGFFGVAYFFTERGIVVWTFGGLLVVGSLVGMWRAVRMGVVIDAAGVRVRGFDSRDQVTPWGDVASIECEQFDARAGIPLHAPIIRLRDDRVLVVSALGSYSRAGAERRAGQLRDFLDQPMRATPPNK